MQSFLKISNWVVVGIVALNLGIAFLIMQHEAFDWVKYAVLICVYFHMLLRGAIVYLRIDKLPIIHDLQKFTSARWMGILIGNLIVLYAVVRIIKTPSSQIMLGGIALIMIYLAISFLLVKYTERRSLKTQES